MDPRPPKASDPESSTRRATRPTNQTDRLLLAVWLVTATALVAVGISWQITDVFDGRFVELGVFLVWLTGLLPGAWYLDARYS